jgi:hypothetical protein
MLGNVLSAVAQTCKRPRRDFARLRTDFLFDPPDPDRGMTALGEIGVPRHSAPQILASSRGNGRRAFVHMSIALLDGSLLALLEVGILRVLVAEPV